jgi:hypothetical protein
MSNTHATIVEEGCQAGIFTESSDLAAKSATAAQYNVAVLSRISYASFNFS